MSARKPEARHRALSLQEEGALNWYACIGALLFGLVIAVSQLAAPKTTTASSAPATASSEHRSSLGVTVEPIPAPGTVAELPVPRFDVASVVNAACELSRPQEGEAFVKAAGGGAALRTSLLAGELSCVDLADPTTNWVVVNKQRPFPDRRWAPARVVTASGVTTMNGAQLQPVAADALAALATASRNAGAGPLGIVSGFRSYDSQEASHQSQMDADAWDAERTSARAGFSEHQTGLAADVVACGGGGCGSMDDFGASSQGKWVAANGWKYGWIVRYEPGREGVTGYAPEPWHLRFVGVEVATAYHAGGYHTLEQFFGLPAAPQY